MQALRKNLLALVVIVLACALATQWPRLANQKLRNELSDSLERLWNQPGQAVELLATSGGVDAQVQAVLPSDCSARQDQWNFQVLRFVSRRYGDPKLLHITLSDRDSKRSIEERSSESMAASESKSQDRSEGLRGPGESANEAHLELIRRQAQAWLDQNLGPGNGLALVDGTAKIENLPNDKEGAERHYLLRRPKGESEGKSAPTLDTANSVAPVLTSTSFTTRLVLLVNGRIPEADKKISNTSELSAELGMVSGRDEVKVVLLP
jgi:hypothetical protein